MPLMRFDPPLYGIIPPKSAKCLNGDNSVTSALVFGVNEQMVFSDADRGDSHSSKVLLFLMIFISHAISTRMSRSGVSVWGKRHLHNVRVAKIGPFRSSREGCQRKGHQKCHGRRCSDSRYIPVSYGVSVEVPLDLICFSVEALLDLICF